MVKPKISDQANRTEEFVLKWFSAPNHLIRGGWCCHSTGAFKKNKKQKNLQNRHAEIHTFVVVM